MSSKYGDDRDPYLYPALNVMRNRLGIRQAQRLEQTAWKSPPYVRRRCRWDRAAAGYPTSVSFIISSIRISSTGRGNSEKSISIRGILLSAILRGLRKRAMR